jgi:uncharacterized protein YcaQ
MIRPAEDMGLHLAELGEFREGTDGPAWHASLNRWVEANEYCHADILKRLRKCGPMLSRDIPDTCVVAWKSSGWTNDKNVTQLLEIMVRRGEVAVAGRSGRERLWDLAERVYPLAEQLDPVDARFGRNVRRLEALGIARGKAPACPVEPNHVGVEVGEPAVVAGVSGEWRVDPAQLGQPFAGRTALISPLDRLIFDRKRMTELFEFDYQLEMYKPAAQRRWGYFALPILHRDRLIGKLDAATDRKAGVLRINAVHEDVPFSKRTTEEVDREIEDLARWLEVDVVRPGG